jgi:8-oxo-dGTP pyrophosphatase MutT (NUDIX family)
VTDPPPPPPEELGSRTVYENRWMRLREDRFRRANGEEGLYAVVEKSPAALVIPLDGDHLWLVEQYRHPVGRRYWEFPQGALEDGGEAPPEEVARRELREETGLGAGRLERLGRVYFAYGISNQPCDVWLATELAAGEAEPEPEEHDLRSARVPVDRFEEMVRAGEIVDAASIAAWTLRAL